MRKLALEPLFFSPGNTMKRFYVLTSFRGCVLSWLTTLNLDWGNDRSFDIYYHSFPMGTCLKHFINTYRCVCWMKSTSIDGLDVPYIRPWPLTVKVLVATKNSYGINAKWYAQSNGLKLSVLATAKSKSELNLKAQFLQKLFPSYHYQF